MSQGGIFPDCSPKPLSQHRGATGSEWTDEAALIPIAEGPDAICIMSSSAALGNQPGMGPPAVRPSIRGMSTVLLIACAQPGTEEADWLDLLLDAYFYIEKTPQVIPKGKTKCLRCDTHLNL